MARKPTDFVQFKLRIREGLRRKVERDSRQPEIVETVLGAGYRLRLMPDG